jgi:uncharacterized membrane protein YphA (DoxX/SURF4 family)
VTARLTPWGPVTYWATTTVVVAESLVGGIADLLRLDPFYPLLIQLGYPTYLATILGAAKILAGLVIACPRLPRLKEWAYAGILINMVGAAASYLATGGHVADYIPPLTFAVLALTSWHLRPATRRLGDDRAGSAENQQRWTVSVGGPRRRDVERSRRGSGRS